jgi:hypothetical protein
LLIQLLRPKVEKSQKHLIVDWENLLTQNPYGGLFDWYILVFRTSKER